MVTGDFNFSKYKINTYIGTFSGWLHKGCIIIIWWND